MTPDPERESGLSHEQAQQSFVSFYTEHRATALTELRVLLAGTGVDPDDVAAGLWTRLWACWRKRGPFVEAPKAYVRQCARHAAIDALRIRTDPLVNVDVLGNMVAHQRGDDSEVQTEQAAPPERDSLEPRDLLTNPQLIDAVQSLTPTERLVMLALIEREPPPNATQIAHALKIGSAATVRVHRANALKKLRDIFGAGDDCGEENR